MDKEIEMSEVEEALKKAKNGKSAGDDGCINGILKAGGNEMKKALLTLFSKMWKEEKIPREWARGVIVPLYKERR